MFRIIHDAADPQIITNILDWRLAHVFQKCSKADKNPDLRLSSQGNSSRNTTDFLCLLLLSRNRSSTSNASTQFSGGLNANKDSFAFCMALLNFCNCSFKLAPYIPVNSKAR